MATPTCTVHEDDHPELELQLQSNQEAPSVARAAVVGFCQHARFSSDAIATLMLLVSEVVTNAVIHPDVDSPSPIGLHARIDAETIRVEVSDHGPGFAPRTRDPSQISGGYGLFLLEKEAQSWGVKSGAETIVWFEVRAARRGDPV